MTARYWWLVELIGALIVTGAILLFVRYGNLGQIIARVVADPTPALAVHPASAGCRLPTEHEQLHIVVMQRQGGFVAECMHVGTRGTYHRMREARQ